LSEPGQTSDFGDVLSPKGMQRLWRHFITQIDAVTPSEADVHTQFKTLVLVELARRSALQLRPCSDSHYVNNSRASGGRQLADRLPSEEDPEFAPFYSVPATHA